MFISIETVITQRFINDHVIIATIDIVVIITDTMDRFEHGVVGLFVYDYGIVQHDYH